MRTHLLTMWYNESFLAPWFLRHYSWVDRIIVLLDSSTTDDSADVIAKVADPARVLVVPICLGGQFDEAARIKIFQQYYDANKDCDYYVIADADEFIFCPNPEDSTREFIVNSARDIIFAKLYNVYPHVTEGPLDYAWPLWSQRRHGDNDLSGWPNNAYVKPNVLRSSVPARFKNGFHTLDLPARQARPGDTAGGGDHSMLAEFQTLDYNRYDRELFQRYNVSHAEDSLIGMHAHLCDFDFAVKRKMSDRVPRSKSHWYKLWARTDMAALFKEHESDPRLW